MHKIVMDAIEGEDAEAQAEAWDGLAGCPEALPAVGLFFGPAPAVLRFPPYQPSGTY